MIAKMALRVCPVPGCAKIGLKQGDRCPDHDRLMIREIYESSRLDSPSSIDKFFGPKSRL